MLHSAWTSLLALPLACGLLLGPGAARALDFKVDLIQFEPWAKKNPDPQASEPLVGILVDLLREFERRSGHRALMTLTPYARVERNLEQGDCDFSLMAWGDARAAYADKGTVFLPLEFGVRARKGVPVRHYDDLHRIVVGTPRGLKVDPRFDADPRIRKDLVLDYTLAIRKAAADRDAMAVAGSLSSIDHIIRKLKLQAEFGDILVLNTTHLTVAYSKKSAQPAAQAQVNAVFKTMVDDGTARRIYQRWMFPPE